MRSGILAVAVAATAVFSVASAHADQLLTGFEGNLNSSLSTGDPFVLQNGVATLNDSTNPVQYTATGATQGATSARFRVPNGFVDGLQLTEGGGVTALRDAYNQNGRFLVDVTIPALANQPDPAVTGQYPYVVLSYYINSDGTGGSFKRSPNLVVLGGAGAADQSAYNRGTVTMYFDYKASSSPILFPADSASPNGYTQFGFTFNSGNLNTTANGGPLVVYLDNLRFVAAPEPTTLGVLAAVGGLVTRRRR